MLQWTDTSLGTVCILPVPADQQPTTAAGDPTITPDALMWRSTPNAAARKYMSQIIMIADRPT